MMDCQILEVSDPRWGQRLSSLHHDIYQLPGYAAVEARRTDTHPQAILVTEGERVLLMPYLLQRCDRLFPLDRAIANQVSDLFDAISPYGYPGLLLSAAAASTPGFAALALQAAQQTLYDQGVCSLFLRLHPILNQTLETLFDPNPFTLSGRTVSIDLTLSIAQLWNQTKPDHRNKINRSQQLGLTARMVPVPDYLPAFLEIYHDTMHRVGATAQYFEFDTSYFCQLSDVLGDRLHLCVVEQGSQIIAAGLYSAWEGIVQALFGGTLTEFLHLSPTPLETDYVRRWAKAQGHHVLHLGGGLGSSQDRLYEFKARFSRQSHPFLTLRQIINPSRYQDLVRLRAQTLHISPDALRQSQFFPVYRTAIAQPVASGKS